MVNREHSVNQISIQLQADDGSSLRVGVCCAASRLRGWVVDGLILMSRQDEVGEKQRGSHLCLQVSGPGICRPSSFLWVVTL